MGWNFSAVPVLKQVYDYYKSEEEKYDWGEKSSQMTGSSQKYDLYGGFNYYYQKGREGVTRDAKKYGWDKPHGDLEKYTDIATDWWNKGAHHLQGKAYGTAGLEGGSGGGDLSGENIKEPGTRATLAGRGRTGGEFDENERRGLQAYNTDTLLTQGQKAKKLKTS